MIIRSKILGPTILGLFVLGIGLSMVTNYWSTESSKVPARLSTGEFAGQFDPADIRGSYSFGDIETNFGIPSVVTARAFGLSEDDAAMHAAKDLEAHFEGMVGGEIGTDSVRLFVALYLGLPFAPGEDTLLPPVALEVLADKMAPADLAGLETRIWRGGSTASPESAVVNTPAASEPARPATSVAATPVGTSTAAAAEPMKPATGVPATGTGAGTGPAGTVAGGTGSAVSSGSGVSGSEGVPESSIRGSTTFGALYTMGLAKDDVAEIIGGEPGPNSQTLRDWASAQGIEFSVIRGKVQVALDKL